MYLIHIFDLRVHREMTADEALSMEKRIVYGEDWTGEVLTAQSRHIVPTIPQ